MSAPSPMPTQAFAIDEVEYKTLPERITKIESKYLVGDVDEPLQTSDSTEKPKYVFEQDLNEVDKLLVNHRDRFRTEHPASYYRFLSIQAEAKEYYDTADANYRLDLYKHAQNLYRDLPKQAIDNEDQRSIVNNMLRVILAGLEHLYFTSDHSAAIIFAHQLERFVLTSGLTNGANQANEILAVIYYFLGRNYRQRGIDDDYRIAIEYFYQSSDFYFESARRRDNYQAEVVYARTRAMVSLAFGAGFLFYNAESDLVRAKALIAQARLAFLKDNGDTCCTTHYYYLELLYASILRAEAGEIAGYQTDEDEVQISSERTAAQEKLSRARVTLDRCEPYLKHKPSYFIHLLYNKALVLLYQGPEYYEESRRCINELFEISETPRWQANVLILKSHLERRCQQFEIALSDALKAESLAGNHLPIRIEALLARGQAQMARGQAQMAQGQTQMAREKFEAARTDFEKALQLNSDANLKLKVIALLYLVETGMAQQRPDRAHERFAEVEKFMPLIRHGFIRNKFRELKRLVERERTDFVIPGATEDLDYKKFDSDLQRWLLEKALREDKNLTRVAKRLNVAKKTIYMWLDKFDIKV